MFGEGHEQLWSLVKAGMSHVAPPHLLIRRALQLRVGLVAIKEVSRISPAGAQRGSTSPPLQQIGTDKPAFYWGKGRVRAVLYRSGLVDF